MKLYFAVFLRALALQLFLLPAVNGAVLYNDEAAFQSAVGIFNTETFETYSLFDPVSGLPSLGGALQQLDNGFFPAAYDQSSGGTAHSGGITLMNNENLTLPGHGDLVFLTNPFTTLSGVGYWNTGGDDTTRLSVFDAADNLLATTVSGAGEVFVGIADVVGVVKVAISAEGGNGWFSIDDLQTSTTVVPVPAAIWLMLASLSALGFSRRKAE